ncbi:MAG: formylglycine-generating enzyme family protein [Planctomycetota bacterium]|jgi:formylglycine-generating enzyme required for sulfatase activity
MMAKSRADRYQDPKELLADLHTHLEGGEPDVGEAALKGSSVNVPIAVRRRVRERRRAPRKAREPGHGAAPERPRDTRRHRRVAAEAGPEKKGAPVAAIAGGVLAAAIVIGMGVFMLGGKKKPPRRRPPAAADASGDTLRTDALQGAAQPDSPGEGQPPIDTRKASASGAAAAGVDVRTDEPPPTLTLDLGGGVEMELVYIKPGVFMMGGKFRSRGETPVHEVAITRGFYMGKYEVTQAQYEAVMGRNPSEFRGPSRPVERMTWHQAAEFCRIAGEMAGGKLRLPTEAEWEYACRAGSTGRHCFGGDETRLGEYAWYAHNSGGQTHPVGQKKPNAWGLHDMYGNVWEWLADWYESDYYAKSPREDPAGPDGGRERLTRGGSWNQAGHFSGSASRGPKAPSSRNGMFGFRVAVSLSPADAAASRRGPPPPPPPTKTEPSPTLALDLGGGVEMELV